MKNTVLEGQQICSMMVAGFTCNQSLLQNIRYGTHQPLGKNKRLVMTQKIHKSLDVTVLNDPGNVSSFSPNFNQVIRSGCKGSALYDLPTISVTFV